MENEKNKSELFMKQYNACLEEGHSEFYARIFAKHYEIAILEKRTEGYAFNFADALGEFVSNKYSSKDDFENDESYKETFNEIKKEFETKQFK